MVNFCNYSIYPEYDFKKFDHNTICLPRDDKEFLALEDAKVACKNRRNCKGVLQPNCTDQSKYYLCTDTAKLVTNLYFNEPSCFYQKYIIGEDIFWLHLIRATIIRPRDYHRFYFLISDLHFYSKETYTNFYSNYFNSR